MISSPWAVLLCKFNDDASEPLPRDYYEALFTASGIGSQNMVDFFRDMSHGNLDLSNTRVFGWYTLDKARSDYGLTGAEMLSNRGNLLDWARQAAAAKGDSLSQYVSVVVCMNVSTDLFGGGDGVVCDNNRTDPRLLGQEMGHFYGLDHSRADTIKPCGDDSQVDYKDFWDVMSTAGCAFSASHPRYRFVGPGLNAANMQSRGWLDESRVWTSSNRSFDVPVTLRPLHRRDLPGYLAARLGKYLIEFRSMENWDAAIPRAAVLIHRFDDNHSYIMSGNNGEQDLVVGDVFGTVDPAFSFTGTAGVRVDEINVNDQFAKIRLVQRPGFVEPGRGPGVLIGGVAEGGGGVIILPGGRVNPVPPHSPLLRVLEQVVAYEAAQSIESTQIRELVRLEALATIATHVQTQMQAKKPFRQPAPPRTNTEA